jgi:serine/threonine protein kinase/WD40 repeat protein
MKSNPDEPTSLMPGDLSTHAAGRSADAVIAEYLEAREAGLNPDPEEFLARYPEYSGELRSFWDSFADFERFVMELGGNCLAPGIRTSSADTPVAMNIGVNDRTRPTSQSSVAAVEFVPKTIGDCEILEEIGRGGMGVVYRARHVALNRIVALKTIPSYAFADDVSRSRFRAEARAAAAMEHPGIVPIYDVGEHGGLPYFTMAYVAGPSLSRKLHEGPLAPRRAAEIIRQTAVAIGWAHSRGFVHRDIKPGNILLDAQDRPMLVDFGLARHVMDESNLTTTGQIIGTPNYISPEQARGDRAQGGPASDIYSLGAVLYCALTGRPPFQSPCVAETLAAVQSHEPVPLRRLDPTVPRDLETITLKCLEKTPDVRYQSAESLADDLQRFLNGDPIQARPIQPWIHTWRWCRRNRAVAGLSGLVIALLIAATAVSSVAATRFESLSVSATNSAVKARDAEGLANHRAADAFQAQRQTRYELARSHIHRARMTRLSHRVSQRFDALNAVREAQSILDELSASGYAVPISDYRQLRDEAASAFLLLDVETEWRLPHTLHFDGATCDFVHKRFAEYSGTDPKLTIRSLEDGRELASLNSSNGRNMNYVQFSDDGRRLLSASSQDVSFDVWNVEANPPAALWSHGACAMVSIADSNPFVAVSHEDQTSRLLDIDTGRPIGDPFPGTLLEGSAISKDGKLAIVRKDGEINIVAVRSGAVLSRFSSPAKNADWSEDGSRVALTLNDRTIEIRSSDTGVVLHRLTGLRGGAKAAIPSSLGLVVGADWFHSSFVWDLNTGVPLLNVSDFGDTAAFSFTGVSGRQRRLGHRDQCYVSSRFHRGRMRELAAESEAYVIISHDSRRLAVAFPNRIGLYDIRSGRPLAERAFPGAGAAPLIFETDDRALLVSSGWTSPGRIERWPIVVHTNEAGLDQVEFGKPESVVEIPQGSPCFATEDVAFAWPRGQETVLALRKAAAGSAGAGWEIHTLKTSQRDVRHAIVSPDQQWCVIGDHVIGQTVLYRCPTGERVKTLVETGGWGHFSPDGRWLAVSHFGSGGEIWRTDDWSRAYSVPGSAITFSADSRTLAVNEGENAVVLFDAVTGDRLVRLEPPEPVGIYPEAFSPDGRFLFCIARAPARLLSIDLQGLRDDLKGLRLDWEESNSASTDDSVVGP